ncbi:MAG: AEC family transporter [Oscillibacter sp.]|nr:AEC family transporter [Oscillibacter sp.]
MEISLILLKEVIKLFLILVMGYALVKTRLLKPADSKSVSVILVYLVIPCMIINSFQIDVTAQVLSGLAFTTVLSIAVHILFLLFTALFARLFRLDVVEQLTVVYTNAGILVIPLIQAILGPEYVVYSCGFLVVQLVLLWTHCRSKLSGEKGVQWKKIFWNVNVLSILAGALLFAARIRLPSLLGETVSSMSAMIGPLGMLLAGMVIADIPFRDVFAVPANYRAAGLRLIAYPLLLLAFCWVFQPAGLIQDGKNLLLVVYLACITPACATLTSMAQLYDSGVKKASVLYVLTTILSIVTMPVMIGLFSAVI